MVKGVFRSLVAFLAIILLTALVFVPTKPSLATSNKVTANPSSVTVTEGASQQVDIRLTQPIICPTLPDGEVCRVDLTFTDSDPAMVSFSSPTITFLANEWSQTKTVTVNATHDFIHSPDIITTATITASGTAPFYTDSTSSFNVTVHNIDDPEFSGTSSFAGTRDDQIAINDLQVTGVGDDTLELNLFVKSGNLYMQHTNGLTFSGQSSGRNLHFSGTRTDINTALTSLMFIPNRTEDVVLQATIGGLADATYNTENHHVYQLVRSGTYPKWEEAHAEAQTKNFMGATGYLATITNQHEQDEVSQLGTGGWIGASDSITEGEWRWSAGPEDGQLFWQGSASGTTFNNSYTHWTDGMPDNYTGSNVNGEDCLQIYDNGSLDSRWNDQNCDAQQSPFYIAEFGDDAHPIFLPHKEIAIHVTTGRDLNGDGIEDADQPQIVDLVGTDGKWHSVVADFTCELSSGSVVSEDSLPVHDEVYEYPNGLLNFTGTCDTPLSNTDIRLYYYDTAPDDLVVRKYNPLTQTYGTIPNVLFETQTINEHTVTVATYHIFDGSDLDVDPGVPGQFTDPVGFATIPRPAVAVPPAAGTASSSSDLANTGESVRVLYACVAALFITSGSIIIRRRATH